MDETFHGRSLKQAIDWSLVITYLVLILIGWSNIYASIHTSANINIFDFDTRSGKQFIWILTALGLAVFILFVLSPRIWESIPVPVYMGVFVLLVAVIFLGTETKGSKSWFEFGPVKFQPAEISKISTSLVLALIMSRPNFKLSKIKDFLLVCLAIGAPMLAILAESETGSALVYVGFIFVLYRQGLSGWFLAIIGLCILLFITTLVASPYVSILILIAVLSFVNTLNSGKVIKGALCGGLFVIFMAFFPRLWKIVVGYFIPGASALTDTTDITVYNTIRDGATFFFLTKIKPIMVLLSVSLIAGFVFFIKAMKERNTFKLFSLAALLGGIVLTYSADFIFNDVLQDHQRKRIEVLLGMKEDPSGVGYNVHQSMIAIGSGGLTGKGYLHGTQTTYGFVPEQSTDFIFCTVGEEWGFIGCAVVILLYCFLIGRILHDAENCRESFTRIYGYCVASCIFMHLFINISMTIGLMPVIGIPLPLLSYGGSSLWAFTVLIFIFLALYRQEKKYF